MSDEVYQISDLTRRIRELLQMNIGDVWVEGEVSNHRAQALGHHYFTLKDASAQLSCVMFKGHARHCEVELQPGIKVKAFGEITVYEARGQYQMIVRLVQPHGRGELQAKFDALKAKLDAEGLFSNERKKAIPKFPRRLALITSPTGAALQDMLNVLKRRAPWVDVLIWPVRVQGGGAETEIADAIEGVNRMHADGSLPPIDTVLLARGGGSLEDLWNFNEEVVARAVADSELPVVCGVGHEIDFSIADFCADLRAPTPSAAAELSVPDGDALLRKLAGIRNSLENGVRGRLTQSSDMLKMISRGALGRPAELLLSRYEQSYDLTAERLDGAFRHQLNSVGDELSELSVRLRDHRPQTALALAEQRLESANSRLASAVNHRLFGMAEELGAKAHLLDAVGPGSVLGRGFSMTLDASSGKPITTTAAAPKGTVIDTCFADGKVRSTVD